MVSVAEKGYDHLGGTFVFCPNCGTQNESAATPCKKCGFKLSGISVPKFKGTMMLNSDQTVAEMIEEHRKKQAQGVPADKIPGEKSKARVSEPASRRNPASSAPPSSLGGPRGPVHQPPRVAVPTRGRMGGTMLGVAPQVGGYAPSPGRVAPSGGAVPPPAMPPPAMPSLEPSSPEPSPSEIASGAETAVPSPVPPAASSEDDPSAVAASVEPLRSELEPATSADESAAAATAALTRPLPVVPDADESAPAEAALDPAPEEPASSPIEPTPAAPEAVAITAPLPRAPALPDEPSEAEKPAPAVESQPPSPARLRALDIVLIICTCGVYGLVLWARQRKRSA